MLTVRVTPNASHDRITGFDDDGILRVRISRPPADGKANKQLIRVLGKALGTAKSGISIIRGGTSRVKTIGIAELTSDEVIRRLKG